MQRRVETLSNNQDEVYAKMLFLSLILLLIELEWRGEKLFSWLTQELPFLFSFFLIFFFFQGFS